MLSNNSVNKTGLGHKKSSEESLCIYVSCEKCYPIKDANASDIKKKKKKIPIYFLSHSFDLFVKKLSIFFFFSFSNITMV